MTDPTERRVGWALLAVVPARMALELAGVPPAARQAGSAVLALGLAVAAAARWRSVAASPRLAPLLGLLAATAIGALRAESWLDAARYGLHLGGPALWVAALDAWPIHTRGTSAIPRPWLVAGGAVAALSAGLLVAGQPAAHVLHGWPRLHGPYEDLHPHASAMATVASTALPAALIGGGSLPAAVGGLAALAVGATWVRGAWLWVGISVAVALAARRRWAALAVGAALVAVALAGPVGERWRDGWALVTGEPPAGGWGALGSWRVRIWGDVLERWVAGGPGDVLLGRGLGGHYGLHRHLEPHSDWLSVLVQLGLVGFVAWGALHVALLRPLIGRLRTDDRALVAFAGLVGALSVAAISNDYTFRTAAVAWLTGLAALAAPRPARPAPPGGSPAPPAPRSA